MIFIILQFLYFLHGLYETLKQRNKKRIACSFSLSPSLWAGFFAPSRLSQTAAKQSHSCHPPLVCFTLFLLFHHLHTRLLYHPGY